MGKQRVRAPQETTANQAIRGWRIGMVIAADPVSLSSLRDHMPYMLEPELGEFVGTDALKIRFGYTVITGDKHRAERIARRRMQRIDVAVHSVEVKPR